MKRLKFLVLAGVVATAMVGAGYAAWTDRIDTTTTINTGTFKVDMFQNAGAGVRTFVAALGNNPSNFENWRDAVSEDRVSATAESDGNNATFHFVNMYPGTMAKTSIQSRNNGTIPAKAIAHVVISETDLAKASAQAMLVDGEISIVDYSAPGAKRTIKRIPFSNVQLAGLETKLNSILDDADVVIQPQYALEVSGVDPADQFREGMSFKILPNALNDNDGEGEDFTVGINFDFVQQNMYVDPDPVN